VLNQTQGVEHGNSTLAKPGRESLPAMKPFDRSLVCGWFSGVAAGTGFNIGLKFLLHRPLEIDQVLLLAGLGSTVGVLFALASRRRRQS
jgi:hypothetical protein